MNDPSLFLAPTVSLKMLSAVSGFFLCLGLGTTFCLQGCPPPDAPERGTVSCSSDDRIISCASALPAGSLVEFDCLEFHRLSDERRRTAECHANGKWSSPPPKCVPDCGRRSASVSLIVHGTRGSLGAFPWHVGMFHLTESGYEYWCGGSLVSETAVITAAHCVWRIPPERLMLAFGKFQREYNTSEGNVQKIKAKKVVMLGSYQDVSGNYNGDIAVVLLEQAVRIDRFAAPVCLDLEQKLMDRQLVDGRGGVVLGWGLTENDTFSDVLRVVKLPVVSDEKCIEKQEKDFKKFVTYTSYCAGFGNGTGVCNGDSGGGMTFFDEDSGRWYLQGLVSVSPRREGTPYCDPRFYTVFTKVSLFSKWLRGIRDLQTALFPPNSPPKKQLHPHKSDHAPLMAPSSLTKKLHLLHTPKILQLLKMPPPFLLTPTVTHTRTPRTPLTDSSLSFLPSTAHSAIAAR